MYHIPLLDKASMERLNSQVENTSKALGEYVTRLDKELKERKEVQELLESFTYQQKQQLKETKLNLEVSDHGQWGSVCGLNTKYL